MQLYVIDGDTIPGYQLAEVPITARRFASSAEERKYKKLKRNIIKVYPYARRATSLLKEIETVNAELNKKRHRKKYLKHLESQLKDQFGKELRKLTVSQGKVLVKLIERETGEPFYKTLKQVKNPISAFFWNAAGKRYGYNLKEGYDPEEYKDLEEIVSFLEAHGIESMGMGYTSFNKSENLKKAESMSTADMVNQYRKSKGKKPLKLKEDTIENGAEESLEEENK